ncbi:hypothetical protein NQ317_003218 [Molorchus minor]|uniref:Carbonyl reductase [NADPH] 1 n=1 Tax=Molorchus minor TaxID=1323400 RepID=A0ABQ9JNE7_9CUCU|nr:hypothetical protein NQ317_003218 [Molorchus minor]
MSVQKIAVVTGANKGIGYEIIKGLCEKYQGTIYLTARNEQKGKDAVKELEKLGYHPKFHQLDISQQASVDTFKQTHLCMNNFQKNATEPPLAEIAEKTIDVNYFGTLRVCEALFPLLRRNAKVVNVSSSAGHLYRIPSATVRAKFTDPNITISTVNELMKRFVKDAKENKAESEGWGPAPYCAYIVSKVGLCALTFLQQKQFDIETPSRNIAINATHPGVVKTDLNSSGVLTPEQGARSTLYVVLETNFKGKYIWWNCEVVDWYGERTPPRT